MDRNTVVELLFRATRLRNLARDCAYKDEVAAWDSTKEWLEEILLNWSILGKIKENE